MTTHYADATKRFRDTIRATMTHTDPSLSSEGLAQLQRQRVDAARAALLAARPSIPADVPSRDSVLSQLRGTTADEIAALQHEQSKITAMLDAGRSFSQIVAGADRTRVLALADLAETLPQVLASESGAEIAAEIRSVAFDRLVELGEETAVEAKRAEDAVSAPLAWHKAMTETAERFDASIGAMQNVYRVDPVGYDLALSGDGRGLDVNVSASAAKWLDVLDATVRSELVDA